MLGIDHNQAGLDVRALFSFTKKNMISALVELQQKQGIGGCIFISTCNRMEIWVQEDDESTLDLYGYLCEQKGIEEEKYRVCFRERSGEEAIYHLFSLTCGLKSQILGEDQIITQVVDALSVAREYGCTNSVLEVLFRKAITAAKKVKSEVVFPKGNISVMHKAIAMLEEKGYQYSNKQCMVIGNGQMGKGAAKVLVEAGAKVWVTVRQYRHGVVEIPEGCIGIDYAKREEYLKACDLVVSATTSPHYTLTKEMLVNGKLEKPMLLIDLAVPRDIEVKANTLEDVLLYDVDDFKVDGKEEALYQAIRKAEGILKTYIDEFYDWLGGHEVMPHIQFIKDEVVSDLSARLTKVVQELDLKEDGKKDLSIKIEQAADKVLCKLLFGLKSSLENEEFLTCMQGLEQLYEE